MKRIYLLMALIVVAIIGLDAIVLYLIIMTPTSSEIQKMIHKQNQNITKQIEESVEKATEDIVPIKGDTGDPGAAGKAGATGKAGPEGKAGIPGPQGSPGQPGREIELAKDPDTGDLYMRYTGDTAWTLVEAP